MQQLNRPKKEGEHFRLLAGFGEGAHDQIVALGATDTDLVRMAALAAYDMGG